MSRLFISDLSERDLHSIASTSMAASPSLLQASARAGTREDRRRKLVGIHVQKNSMANEDFFQDKFISGDVVEKVEASPDDFFTSAFPTGKHSLLKELHNFHESGVSILTIQVKRGEREITRKALIVPVKRKKYVLQDFEDPSHIFSFEDYTVEKCNTLQAGGLRLAQEQLSKTPVATVDVAYPWDPKSRSVNGFTMVYSMLVVPRAHVDVCTSQSSTLEDATLQAMTWLHGSKASGVPLVFHSIQTELIFTEDVERISNADLSSGVSSGACSLHQLQGCTDRRVVLRAVRMWFAFHGAEVKVELEARQGEGLLGVTIGRTIEGFCYVAEVVPRTAAYRVGLMERLDLAKALGRKLVVTKVGNERVLPWCMSNGSIRCYDINSISSKLSAHRRAGQAACLYLLDIRDTACPTESLGAGPSVTSSFGDQSNASTYRDL